MPAIQDTAYPRLRATYDSTALARLFAPSPEECALAERVTKGVPARLGFLVLLKTFQLLGSFVPLATVPPPIIESLATRAQLTAVRDALRAYDRSGSRRRHVALIRTYFRVRPFDRAARRQTIDAVAAAAASNEVLADLINVAISELIKLRVELPAFSTLTRLARHVHAVVYRRYYRQITASLSTDDRAVLDAWFVADPATRLSPLC